MVTYVKIGICEPDVLTAGHFATLGRDDSLWKKMRTVGRRMN